MTAHSFAPTGLDPEERYQIERKLGEGATGNVYLVRDRETGEQLALKKLFRMDAKSVLRLKREFRSLQALNHPHIVKLYDMGQAGDGLFLTMEYLDGAELTTYLHAEARLATGVEANTTSTAGKAQPQRVLLAFLQLARAIQALHDAGMLHRDLKPSNVLVVDHRVVVLDFGLVRELSVGGSTLTEDGSVAGTPAYMAPEQIETNELSAASDWYAFGAMLYEAISGQLPFDGSMMQLLRAKLDTEPQPLAGLAPGVPEWLSGLCMALLRRKPAERPTGPEVIARLQATQPAAALPTTATENLLQTESDTQTSARQLVGRAAEVRLLWNAFAQTEDGKSVVVHVRAPSGTGKSALVEHFLDQIERRGPHSNSADALVLRSRCYELEAMPFKALDGLLDALTHHLLRLDDFEVGHLLPVDVTALACVFPVLERLNAVRRLKAMEKVTPDPIQSRRRAETALRVLLDNMASRVPLVIWIDDLQWGDLDSARILRSWLVQPSAAPILFVFSYRSDEVTTSTCLSKLLEDDAEQPSQALEHALDIAPLKPEEIRALCEPRLSADTPLRQDLIERVVREAQGSPFFASQLIALAQAKSARGDADLDTLSLDLMVAQTGAILADAAKKLLALLAVASRPLPPRIALQASGVKHGGRALVHELRVLNLVRTRDVGGARMLEVYHDRIRERVLNALSDDESRELHETLLRTLIRSGESDAGWLHTLALGSEDLVRALQYGTAAAERANAGLAFDRAAGLYRSCIALVPDSEAGELWNKLSHALARCGHGVEAAKAALKAAEHATPEEQAASLQRAASHYLRCGHFAQGEALVRRVLAAYQIDVPKTDAGMIAAIVWERARVRWIGTEDVLRNREDIAPELLRHCDVLTALANETQIYHPVRGALFQVRSLRMALEAGEPGRLVKALCSAATMGALDGSEQAAREADELIERAIAINAKRSTPDNLPVCVARAVKAFMLGRMSEVIEYAREADALFRADTQDDPIGNYFRRFLVASVRIGALHYFGNYAEFTTELRDILAESAAVNNRALVLQLAFSQTHADQLGAHAARTRARLEAQRAELPDNGYGVLHVLHILAVMNEICWSGDYSWSEEHLENSWTKFLSSPVRRAAYVRNMAHEAHARLLLNKHVALGREGDPARAIAKDLRALDKLPPAAAVAARFRARVAHILGQGGASAMLLRKSSEAYRSLGMEHEIARNDWALGALQGGEAGAEQQTLAQARMTELGVGDPAADMRAHFPEFYTLERP